jgi:acyl-CoA reductase-like NAD-dependent aldehyde dehydrogenase
MPLNDDDSARTLMNDSRFALTASIWTTDVDAAIRIGDSVETGTWYLNRCDYLDPARPGPASKIPAAGARCHVSATRR